MDTKRIQDASVLVNRLKNYKGLQISEFGTMEMEELPDCKDYDLKELKKEIMNAMNQAAQDVVQKHIFKSERKLCSIFEEVKKQSDLELETAIELESVIPKEKDNLASADDPLID